MRLYRRGQFWHYEFEHDGVRYRASTKSKNQRVAGQIASAEHIKILKGESGIVERRKAPKFKAAMKDFLDWSKQEHQAHPNTAARYVYSSAALLRFFGDDRLDTITPEDVERFKASRATEKRTTRGNAGAERRTSKIAIRPATVNRELACLRAMFNHAMKGETILRNPVSRVKFLAEMNEQNRVLTFKEQRLYLAAATTTLCDVATIILETGMRPEEVFNLKPANVHLENGFLVIPTGKTAAARRRITLTSAAQTVLRARLAAKPKHYLFECDTDAKRPLPNVHGAHHRALAASKLPAFRLYDLRHTWATRAAESGIDLVTLASMLGHSRIQMVLRYAHPGAAHQASAMAKLEQHNAEREIQEFGSASPQ
jgi:integrase